jgi:hypothetical protein
MKMPDNTEAEVETYYLRPDVHHNVIYKGENVRLEAPGDTAELTEAQYDAFKDKFFTKTEYKAFQEEQTRKSKEEADAASVTTAGDHMERSQIATQNQPEANVLATNEGKADEVSNKGATTQNSSKSAAETGSPESAQTGTAKK